MSIVAKTVETDNKSHKSDKSNNKSAKSKLASVADGGGPHSVYIEKLSDIKSTKKSPEPTSRKMYFDVKKELDVARIESLIN